MPTSAPGPGPGPRVPPTGPRPGELVDRFVARLVDAAILVVVDAVVGSLAVNAMVTPAGGLERTGFVVGAVTTVLGTAINLGYFALMESGQGRTVGKLVVRLRTVGPDGSHPTLEQAFRRNIWLGFGVLGVVPVVGTVIGVTAQLVAVVLIAVEIRGDPVRRQGWHDHFAGETRVIKDT